MSLFSKLFGRKKSKVEERRIESEVEKVIEEPTPAPEEEHELTPDQLLAVKVLQLKKAGKFNKDYQLIHNFIVNSDAEDIKGGFTGHVELTKDNLSKESLSFIKQYKVRGLKCSDSDFVEFINNFQL